LINSSCIFTHKLDRETHVKIKCFTNISDKYIHCLLQKSIIEDEIVTSCVLTVSQYSLCLTGWECITCSTLFFWCYLIWLLSSIRYTIWMQYFCWFNHIIPRIPPQFPWLNILSFVRYVLSLHVRYSELQYVFGFFHLNTCPNKFLSKTKQNISSNIFHDSFHFTHMYLWLISYSISSN